VLDPTELADVARLFGVADTQVRRDHLISHLLAAIARLDDERELGLVFYGGTALAIVECDFAALPRDLAWNEQLAHQTRDLPPPDECLAAVREEWTQAAGWDDARQRSRRRQQ